MKQIEKDTLRWKKSANSWIRRINIIKMFVLSNMIYRFNVIPIRILRTTFTHPKKMIIKFIWKQNNLILAKAINTKLEAIQFQISRHITGLLQSEPRAKKNGSVYAEVWIKPSILYPIQKSTHYGSKILRPKAITLLDTNKEKMLQNIVQCEDVDENP